MSATPTCTLIYFDTPGRGECLRLAFAISNTPFEDRRVSREEFQQIKKEGRLPYGALPVLEVKDAEGKTKVIAESAAIMTYICKEHGEGTGLKPTSTDDVVRTTEVASLVNDLNDRLVVAMYESDRSKQQQMFQEIQDKVIPRVFSGLENRLLPSGHTIEKGISAGDLALFGLHAWFTSGALKDMPRNCLEPYERTMKCIKDVENHPAVKGYYSKRGQRKS